MVVRLVEYLNMSAHIVVGFPLNVTVVKQVHDANASLPIVVTPSGIVIFVSLLQLRKASALIVLSDEGRSVMLSSVQALNAPP